MTKPKIVSSKIFAENKDENLTSEEILNKHFEKKPLKPNKNLVDNKKKEKLIKQVLKEVKEKEFSKSNNSQSNKNFTDANDKKIEFIIEKTSYFKPNWFYFKTVFINCKNFIFHPIKFFKTRSAHSLATSKINNFAENKIDENENLYEEKILDKTTGDTEEIIKMNKKTSDKLFEIVRSDK